MLECQVAALQLSLFINGCDRESKSDYSLEILAYIPVSYALGQV